MIKIKFFDGYIKNKEELCQQLFINKNLSQREKILKVLIEGYQRWGKDLPVHLRGYFSFALYDTENNVIFGARDRFGVVPFYYANNKFALHCDCYIKKILSRLQIAKKINEKAVQLFMTFGFVPGTETFFQNINQLRPGFRIIYNGTEICIEQYHTFCQKEFNWSFDEYKDKIDYILSENLKRMEVPKTGILLSSGIDSNYLYAMSNIKKAFSIGFAENFFDESMIAYENAQLYYKNCERVILKPEDFFESVEDATIYMEQPIGNASSVAFMNGCKYASEKMDMCFTGEGADELFAGYEIYKKSYLFSNGLTYLGKSHIFEESEKKSLLKYYIDEIEDRKIVQELCPRKKMDSNLNYMMNVDIQMWLANDSFINTFKMSNPFKLKIRMPFIDEELFELAYSMPDDFKIQKGVNKYILRRSSEKVVPPKVSYYEKRGFVTPIRQWMKNEKHSIVIAEILNGEGIRKFYKEKEVNRIYNEFLNGNQKIWRKIWLLYSFAKWYEINF